MVCPPPADSAEEDAPRFLFLRNRKSRSSLYRKTNSKYVIKFLLIEPA